MDNTTPFEVLVVDEAAQSVEVSTIIPLRLGCKHCVLVGDPNQLPATVFSQVNLLFCFIYLFICFLMATASMARRRLSLTVALVLQKRTAVCMHQTPRAFFCE